MWPLDTAPTDWIECNGQSTAAYPELAALLGATVPDLRGEFVRGWDNGRGTDSGRAINTDQAGSFESHAHGITDPGHNHAINDPGHGHNYSAIGANGSGGNGAEFGSGYSLTSPNTNSAVTSVTVQNNSTGIAGTNTQGSTETRPRNVSLMHIIRAR
jgi:microcystin-dependent protein